MRDELASLRVEYDERGFSARDAGVDPMERFTAWLHEASRDRATGWEANAMTLATVATDGTPSARMVLLKDIDPGAGSFTWFTNLDSRKAREIEASGRAALCWWWPASGERSDAGRTEGRQVRATGRVHRVSRAVSAEYFATRPQNARIGAATSNQSRAIAARAELDTRATTLAAAGDVELPEDWGGLELVADELEFWQGRAGRLHDRITFLRLGDDDLPFATSAVEAAGGLETVRAAGTVVTDAAGTRWLRVRLEP